MNLINMLTRILRSEAGLETYRNACCFPADIQTASAVSIGQAIASVASRYSVRTERVRVYWARWYIYCHGVRHPMDMSSKAQGFACARANEPDVSQKKHVRETTSPGALRRIAHEGPRSDVVRRDLLTISNKQRKAGSGCTFRKPVRPSPCRTA